MNIIVGVILGQLLFYLSMYAGDWACIVANEIFTVYSLYVIYLSIRKAHIGKNWKRVHSCLFYLNIYQARAFARACVFIWQMLPQSFR